MCIDNGMPRVEATRVEPTAHHSCCQTLQTSRHLGATNKKMIVSTLVRDGESEMQGNMEDITHRHTVPWLRGHPPRAARAARSRETRCSCDSRLKVWAKAIDSGVIVQMWESCAH